MPNIPRKLVDKYTGPYHIIQRVGKLAYELEIPHKWKQHPVFNVTLLRKEKTSTLPGRSNEEPPPLEVDGEEEYEVADILDSRRWGRGHKLQYLVQWKGYGPEHNSWEAEEDLVHADSLVQAFHKRHPKHQEKAPRLRTLWDIATVPERLGVSRSI